MMMTKLMVRTLRSLRSNLVGMQTQTTSKGAFTELDLSQTGEFCQSSKSNHLTKMDNCISNPTKGSFCLTEVLSQKEVFRKVSAKENREDQLPTADIILFSRNCSREQPNGVSDCLFQTYKIN